MKKMLIVPALVAVICLAREAAAYDLPAVNLGFTSFLDGGPPAGPGFYFTEYLQCYSSDRFTDKNGHELKLPTPTGFRSADLQVFVSLNQLIYQSNQKVLLGGKWGFDFIAPFVAFDMKPKDNLAVQDDGAGLGDILVGPYIQWDPIMGAQGPIFMHRFEFQMLVPTGRYDHNVALNPGSNFFSIDPYWAGTLFIGPKWTASWRIHYLWNDTNDDPLTASGANTIQAGQAVHANFATEYEVIPKHLRLGMNGYVLKQVTDTKVNGDNVGGREEQVVGLGPGAIWHISPNDHIFANIYFEFAAENRPEGQRYNLRWVHHF